MAEMSEGAPAPVEVPLPDDPDPKGEEPFDDPDPYDPPPKEPLPEEPDPKGNDPPPEDPELPPVPVLGLAVADEVADDGHTVCPSPTPANAATRTTTATSDITRPLDLFGAGGACIGFGGGQPR
jgi:hypothetical protein